MRASFRRPCRREARRFFRLAGLVSLRFLPLIATFTAMTVVAADPVEGNASLSTLSLHWLATTGNESGQPRMRVEVRGLSRAELRQLKRADWPTERWQKLLAIYADQGDWKNNIGLPPMLGRHVVEDEALQFHPRFPLEAGVAYRAVFHPSQLPKSRPESAPLTSTHQTPAKNRSPKTAVAAIYPTADVLPENLLKFYVDFTGPMSGGHIYDHIHLRNESGEAIELPFLEIDEELWNFGMTRLTLFIDPGRIKRGVKPLEDIGPALESGRSYTLAIDADWLDADGAPLKAAFRKAFRVGPPDRTAIEPARWTIQPPAAGSTSLLVVQFPEPLDYALAQRVIWVRRESSVELAGKTALRNQEREWSFAPERPWTRGRHELLVQTTIEDLAGNNIGKTFEVDLFEGVQRRATNMTVRVPFEVR